VLLGSLRDHIEFSRSLCLSPSSNPSVLQYTRSSTLVSSNVL
jgi:hypothetical protein